MCLLSHGTNKINSIGQHNIGDLSTNLRPTNEYNDLRPPISWRSGSAGWRANSWLLSHGQHSALRFIGINEALGSAGSRVTGGVDISFAALGELELVGIPNRNQIGEEAGVYDASRARVNLNSEIKSPDCEYLDLMLIRRFKFWLAKLKIIKRVRRSFKRLFEFLLTMNRIPLAVGDTSARNDLENEADTNQVDEDREISGRNDIQSQGQINSNERTRVLGGSWIYDQLDRETNEQVNGDEGLVNSESSLEAKKRLINVLHKSKGLNLIILTCHTLLVLEMIKRSMGSSGKLMETAPETIEAVKAEAIDLVSDSPLGADLCKYSLIVAVMDMVGNLYWCHSMATIVAVRLSYWSLQATFGSDAGPQVDGGLTFKVNQSRSWFKSTALMVLSPRHLFQVLLAALAVAFGPFEGRMGVIIGLVFGLNQATRCGYNLSRVMSYLRHLDSKPDRLRRGQRQEQEPPTIYSNERIDGHEEDVDSFRSIPTNGWSQWPLRCSWSHRKSHLYSLDRILIISQILAVKMSILGLLIRIEARNLLESPEGLALGLCLIESFLAMHSYYDKYHSRYLSPKVAIR